MNRRPGCAPASAVSVSNGQLNLTTASRYRVSRTVEGATPTRRATSLPDTLVAFEARRARGASRSSLLASPLLQQKPQGRTLSEPAEAPSTGRLQSGSAS
jgi:hypothetical protein